MKTSKAKKRGQRQNPVSAVKPAKKAGKKKKVLREKAEAGVEIDRLAQPAGFEIPWRPVYNSKAADEEG